MKLKAILVAMMLIGAVASFGVPGVWALFSAETRNVQANASTGTLVFDLQVGSGTRCNTKNGTTNVITGCSAELPFDTAAEIYPGVPRTAQVTITNDGSLDASDLSLYIPSGCSTGSTSDAPASVVGSGDPCTSDQFYVQETNAAFTPTKCWYPNSGTTCAFSSALTLSTYFNNFKTAASALSLGAGPAALQKRYFVIGVQVPSTATNTVQGKIATFDLTWHMTS
jgi:hypothetical protein